MNIFRPDKVHFASIVAGFFVTGLIFTLSCAPPPASNQNKTIFIDEEDVGNLGDVGDTTLDPKDNIPDLDVVPPQDIDQDCEYDPIQQLADPCCLKHGLDACGANLFCAAFDGRTIASCHPENSRDDNASCYEDIHCASSSCNQGVSYCRAAPSSECLPTVGCANQNDGRRYACIDGVCTESEGNTGDQCSHNDNCLSGICASGFCSAGEPGDSCTRDSDCVSQSCEDDICILECTGTQTFCRDSCVDLQSSANHCGECGFSCLGGCENAQCKHDVVKIASGPNHTCALVENGKVLCWGENTWHQAGSRSSTDDDYAVLVSELDGVSDLSLGAEFTCALLNNGNVKCWGKNDKGQIGNGTEGFDARSFTSPQLVKNLSQVSQISSGILHTCALLNNGQVMCWGDNSLRQVSVNSSQTTFNEPVLLEDLNQVIQIAAGERNTCALHSDGTLTCWGKSLYLQSIAVQLSGVTDIALSRGVGWADNTLAEFACAILNDATIQCWGYNNQGQLGDGTISLGTKSTTLLQSSPVKSLSLGTQHSCAVLNNNKTQCWGSNSNGQVGVEGDGIVHTPTDVPDVEMATQLALGVSHSCALLQNGLIKCWGSNGARQLGNGKPADLLNHAPSVVYSRQ